MTHFLWTSNLNTGIDLIDDDHRQLVGMINALTEAITEGRGRDVMGKVLDNLVTYYKVHFGREEEIMVLTNFPGYEQHKFEHDKFIAEVDQLKSNFDSGAIINSSYVDKFLSDWLRNHIIKVDTKLAATLRRQQ